ncbi:MAG: peptide-methionine (S)-S-oxide reductase MsrA [Gammaproteobacteria bacterium]|nr:peptide-methionine (S)-S-oxide reductase MsrA [Gammaproteobacteria bacterium]
MLRKSLIALVAGIALPGVILAQPDATGTAAPSNSHETALFAGGCFWCVESDFDKIPGVIETVSGYTGGHKLNPTYEEVSAGGTGHAEAVQVVYDPAKVSYKELVDKFWRTIDPTTPDRQFCDSGSQYRTAIFYANPQQKIIAEQSKMALEKTKPFKAPLVTEIMQATTFYAAEEYHQNFYKKNPVRYNYYRFSCGRDQRLEQLWGKEQGRATH